MLIIDTPADYRFFDIVSLENQYMFLFRSKAEPSKIKISFTHKEEAMTKVINCYKNGLPLGLIDHLTKVLKISRRDFYLKLWHNSNRDFQDIRTKLMLCEDVFAIKEEMKFSLRKKINTVTDVIEICTSIY